MSSELSQSTSITTETEPQASKKGTTRVMAHNSDIPQPSPQGHEKVDELVEEKEHKSASQPPSREDKSSSAPGLGPVEIRARGVSPEQMDRALREGSFLTPRNQVMIDARGISPEDIVQLLTKTKAP